MEGIDSVLNTKSDSSLKHFYTLVPEKEPLPLWNQGKTFLAYLSKLEKTLLCLTVVTETLIV
jgi:hypothetical protein